MAKPPVGTLQSLITTL